MESPDYPSPPLTAVDLADLRRRLLRLVRQAHRLDRGQLIQLDRHVDDALDRIDDADEPARF